MVDNVIANPGVGGATFAADDVGGVMYPRMKLSLGADGSASDASDANPIPMKPGTGVVIPTSVDPIQAAGFYPGFTPPPDGELRSPAIDEYGAQFIRGGVTTDEGSVRVGYAGSSLSRALPGTPTWAASKIVTGSGFSTADPQLLVNDYIKRDSDGESAWAQIYSIDSDTQITLHDAYTGTAGTAVGSVSGMKPVTGSGSSFSVSGGNCTITCGTTASIVTSLLHEVDYGPLIYQTGFTVSARDANRTIYRGFTQPSGNRRYFAHFKIDGAVNTTVICETGWAFTAPASGTDTQTTTFTLPYGKTTAVYADYRIEIRGEVCSFYVDDILVGSHKQVLPRPYDVLSFGTIVVHGATPPAAANIVIGYETCNNNDSFRISIANQTDNIIASLVPAQTFSYSVAGVIAINTDLLIIDMSQIAEVSIHCTSMGTTGVVTAQWSNTPDFAGVQTATLYDMAGVSSTTFNAAVLRKVNRQARYLRLRLTTATTAGTTTINVTGYPTASAPVVATQVVSGTVSGNLNAGANAIGDVGLQYRATATGAATPVNIASPATPAATAIKASAGRFIGFYGNNTNAAQRYLKIFNVAFGSVTLGTTSAILDIPLTANGNPLAFDFEGGIGFATAMSYAVTGGRGLTDNTAITGNEVTGFLVYA